MYLNFKGLLVLIVILKSNFDFAIAQTTTQSACYDKNGIAKTCLTYPKNVALNRDVVATDTCGTPSETFCRIGANQDRCQICDAGNSQNSHPATKMVDFHNPANITWWQSSSWWQMKLEGLATLARPPKVNVTINFKKLYLISGGIRVTFYTVRPKSMVMQRSTDNGITWSTYQYFAKNCQDSYGLVADPEIISSNRFQATCSQRFSNELPNIGGVVVFDPKLTRYQINEYLNPIVQNYLAATDIRLLLDYPGTDGRENIDSESTLNQYYYAISDVVVDARCHCHGHAEYCDFTNNTEKCDCKHFTTGKDCQRCLPLYNNRTWLPGNETNANECQRCQCNDHASSCVYNKQIGYGICLDCGHNTTGSNCERCVEKFYRNISRPLNDVNVCISCDCFMFGVRDNGTCLQTASGSQQLGQCNCKTGVYGRRCDQCIPGKWGFAIQPIGTCFDCLCNVFGTIGSNQSCDPYTGQCKCKSNIQSRSCSECKDGFYEFPSNSTADCHPCGCNFAGGYPVCNKLTGVCTCRQGITGKQCSSVSDGYYFPNFTHVKAEVEMLSQQNHEYFWLQKGYRSLYLGIGQIKLNSGQMITYSFEVPVTHRYFVFIRYSLYPISWLNSLLLYGAESLTWTGSDSLSSYIAPSDTPSQWNISVMIKDPSNSLLKSTDFSIASLRVGEANTWNDSPIMHLSSGVVYTITIRYTSGSGSGTPWPLLVDSVILMPDLSQSSYYSMQNSQVKSEISLCFERSASLSTTFSLPSQCREHVFSVGVVMYNGSIACSCFTPGSVNPSACEPYGGQCTCKAGYGGRRCEHCLPGYYGNPSSSCNPCGCSSSGSITPVCNQTTGNCFCKTNTHGPKCGNCKPGTFSLAASNPDGCQSCYGFGHLRSCVAAKQFVKNVIVSNFTLSRDDGWSLINEAGSIILSGVQMTTNGLQYIDEGGRVRFLSAPSKYLGNQLNSYGQKFTIQMRFVTLSEVLLVRQWHVKLVGGGMTAVFAVHPRISVTTFEYSFLLHERFMANQTKLSEFAFKSLLGQLSAIHIGLNYFQNGAAVIFQSVQMVTANFTSPEIGSYVNHVENATCEVGYEGLSCERCAKGYTRTVPNGGPLINCEPCNCSGRSMECDQQSGICTNCRTGTTGDHCEKCMPNLLAPSCTSCTPGYWKISPNGCQPCNCYLPGTINGSSISCDLVSGQCACNSSMNVAGRQCNQCKQNAYNVSLGELQCKPCPPCYTPVEQDYVLIKHQTDLLGNEIRVLSSTPDLVPSVPLDQSLAVLSALVSSLLTKANAASSNMTTLDSSWASMQTQVNTLQSSLSSTTATSVALVTSTTNQVLSSYNQTYASIVTISTMIISSYNQLSKSVALSVSQQENAMKQLRVLLNETAVFLQNIQLLSNQANSLRLAAITRVSQSIQIALSAANDSQGLQSSVTLLSSSMPSLRSSVALTQSQGSELHAFAEAMRNNASAVSAYASQIRANVTSSLPDHSQTISMISTNTTSLSTQISSLNTLITSATREINGVEQQISTLKQANTILNSRISTTERRLEAVQSSMSSASVTTAAAISSAVNTEKEAVSMLNTVRNFRSVSQQAAVDAANALTKINTVMETAYSATNITANISKQLTPIQVKVNQVASLSVQSKQIADAEAQTTDSVHQSALRLKNETNAALNQIQGLNVQQYINANVTPLLSRCLNYTSESRSLLQNVVSASTQSQLSMKTAQTIAVSVVNISLSISNIPTINRNQLTPIYDNMLRVKGAYSALGIASDLSSLRSGIEAIKSKVLDYRSRVNSLKSLINSYQVMYNSLETLKCNVQSQIP